MNKKKVLVTGGAGRIGTIIFEALKDNFDFTLVDLCSPKVVGQKIQRINVAEDYKGLKKAMEGQHAVVHLAWDSKENWKTQVVVPENKTMAENVYRAAAEVGVKR